MHEPRPRFLHLLTSDRIGEAAPRAEWIHRDHIETVEAWPEGRDEQRGWLELALTSGRTRYVPITIQGDLDEAASAAIRTLLDADHDTVTAER